MLNPRWEYLCRTFRQKSPHSEKQRGLTFYSQSSFSHLGFIYLSLIVAGYLLHLLCFLSEGAYLSDTFLNFHPHFCLPGPPPNPPRLPDLRSVITLDSRQPGMFHFEDVMQAGGSQHAQQLQDLQKKISFDDPINIQFTSVITPQHPRGHGGAITGVCV